MENIHIKFPTQQEVSGQVVYHLPKRLGRGVICTNHFSSGLSLVHVDVTPDKPFIKTGELPGGYYGISFGLIGDSRVYSSEYWKTYKPNPGQSAHFICHDPFVVKEAFGVSRRVKILIMFDHKTLLNLADGDEELFLPFLRGDRNQIFVGHDKMSTAVRQSLNQVASCPYSGKTRTLYLEGKTMEIFAQKLNQMRAKKRGCPCRSRSRISKTDIERIQYAAQLLVRDPVNPPALKEMTEKIGMSKTIFYQKFKKVFGHSPMEHLRSYRLQMAAQLLQQGDYNVTEAAFAVGYTNLSNFTKIFVAEFGMYPHQVCDTFTSSSF